MALQTLVPVNQERDGGVTTTKIVNILREMARKSRRQIDAQYHAVPLQLRRSLTPQRKFYRLESRERNYQNPYVQKEESVRVY